jgi:hypothetical protein
MLAAWSRLSSGEVLAAVDLASGAFEDGLLHRLTSIAACRLTLA